MFTIKMNPNIVIDINFFNVFFMMPPPYFFILLPINHDCGISYEGSEASNKYKNYSKNK